jgi:hypothetical protein
MSSNDTVVLRVIFVSLFLSLVQREITRKYCPVILPPSFFITDQNFDSCREELPSSHSSSSFCQNLSLSVCLILLHSFQIFVLIFTFLRQESIYKVILKSVKHFKNPQQTDYTMDYGNSYTDREINSSSFFKEKPADTIALICR